MAETLQRIDSLSPADYVDALYRVRPTEQQWNLLRVHLAAPGQSVTASYLARTLGFANWRAVISFYGRFAGKLCAELGISPATRLTVLAQPFKSPSHEYCLRLRSAFIEALKGLGIENSVEHMPRSSSPIPDVDLPNVGIEGAARLVSHLRRERRRSIVEAKKLTTLKATGRLCCEVCGFDFPKTYGAVGEGYCEVHHLVPLSASSEAVTTTLDDLAVLCSNCHRVIHRSTPMLSVAELSRIVRGNP